jgi:tetratricopeptide (TPR) repeat protein
MPAVDPQALRDALARRLTGAPSRTPVPRRPTPLGSNPLAYANPQDAVDALKRRYRDRLADATKAQAKKYADVGHAARAKNDMVAASNAYRVALSFAPDDKELAALAEEATLAADQILASSYMKQAQYEEKCERWPEAAKSWGRVAKTRPDDPRTLDRWANAIAHASGDRAELHRAADAVKKAISIDPRNLGYRHTLASVLMAAGLFLNAKRELEAALELDPKNPATLALVKRVQKEG